MGETGPSTTDAKNGGTRTIRNIRNQKSGSKWSKNKHNKGAFVGKT